jgi:hypothetical protein
MKDDKNKNQFDKRRKDNKTLRKKSEKGRKKGKKHWQKTIKKKESNIKVPAHELLASTLSYLMLAPWWYINPSNLSLRTPLVSSLIILYLSSHYWIILLPHYELVSPSDSVGYVQTISNDVARASPRLVPPPVSRVCHRSRPDLFLCCHKSIVACASQLRLVVGHVAF